MNIIPIIVVGGALIFAMKKKPAKKKALPPTKDDTKSGLERGTVFQGKSPPDLIKAKVGEHFTVSFPTYIDGYVRTLAASPPDNSVEFLGKDTVGYDADPDATSSDWDEFYIFKGAKAGKGSIVFHNQEAWMVGKETPSDIVEILTEIS